MLERVREAVRRLKKKKKKKISNSAFECDYYYYDSTWKKKRFATKAGTALRSVTLELVGWLVGCLTSQQHGSVHLGDRSARTILRAATLR